VTPDEWPCIWIHLESLLLSENNFNFTPFCPYCTHLLTCVPALILGFKTLPLASQFPNKKFVLWLSFQLKTEQQKLKALD